ncbi:MAG: AAA family ATPase [Halioglobus sp.]
MYYQYFGLNEAPFSIAVNPRYLFMSPRHRDALAHLLYGVGAGGGFILLTGEVGTGKTTINRCLLEQLPDNTDIAIILNPALNAQELLASACDELGIDYGQDQHSLKVLTDRLHAFLLENHARDRKTTLLIDEAQHLDFDVLEQIRLLTNLETNSEKLLQIILIGQPELAHKLGRPELRQLNQRITARYNLEALNLEETGAYIKHRLEVAGLAPGRELFTPGLVKQVHRKTRGIPRLINLLCDRALLGAYGRGKNLADRATLEAAAVEVLGESLEPAPKRDWRLPALSAGLVIAVGVALYLLINQPALSPVSQSSVHVEESNVAVLSPPASTPAESTTDDSTTSDTAPQMDLEQAVANTAEKNQSVGSTASIPGVDTQEEVKPADWLRPPAVVQAQLWSLYSSTTAPVVCDAIATAGVSCSSAQASTWDELATFNRPLLLDMVTPERFAAASLLLRIEGRNAFLLGQQGAIEVSLATLAPLWQGTFRYFWHPPSGFERPLQLGDDGPGVAAIAQQFAVLDNQQTPLTSGVFTTALEQRVRIFQRDNNLTDDGVVGEQTLLRLNEQSGVDITASEAIERFTTEKMSPVNSTAGG